MKHTTSRSFVVNPIVNGLKHTKKTNFVENSNPSGFMSGNKKHTIQNDIAPAPTNRQMQEERVGLNYLQVNRFNDPKEPVWITIPSRITLTFVLRVILPSNT